MGSFLSISNNLSQDASMSFASEGIRPIILCDFDGTISLKDVTDILLTHFAKEGYEELEEQWLNGVIGSQECMSKQIALLDTDLSALDKVLAQVEIDPHFKDFTQMALSEGIKVHVVSDGLDYAIQSVLKRNGLGHIPIFANKLLHDNERSWRLEFPYANKNCVKASGNCKCNHLKQQRQHHNHVIYVGDGSSDFCVSNKVDIVLAKDKLVDYCEQHHINHISIDTFADASLALPVILANYACTDYATSHRIPAMSIE